MDYYEIFKKFNDLKIDYIIVGGLAVNFHGVPRMTYDIDIMINLKKDNIKKLVDELIKWGYKLKIPVSPQELSDIKKIKKWIKEKNVKAINFYHEKYPIAEIDIILDSPIPYSKLKKNIVFFEIYGEKLPVININDLIYIKSKSKRKQDLADVYNLKRILEMK
ncbi:MAG: hypothetical protein ABIM49_05430 [candidate division WOR-3 bacterium]